MVLAANEAKLNPKMIGGAMVGLQSTVFKTKLGPALNGYMNYDFWLPAKSLMFKGTAEFMQKYQDRAAKAGVDPLGYYMAPFSYSYLDVLGQAITATKSVDDAKLADYLRKTTFKTIVGDVSFGKSANGRSRGSSRRNSAGSRAMVSTSSRIRTPWRSSHRRNTSRAT